MGGGLLRRLLRECVHCLAGLRQYCTGGEHPGTPRNRARRPAHLRRLQRQHRRRRDYVCAFPTRSASMPPHRCCARASPAAAALECQAGQADRRHGPRRSGPHGGQARRGDGRRGDGAVAEPEDGGRPCDWARSHYYRDRRPRHVQKRLQPFDDPQYRLGRSRSAPVPGACWISTARSSNDGLKETHSGAVSASSACAATCQLVVADRRCWTSVPFSLVVFDQVVASDVRYRFESTRRRFCAKRSDERNIRQRSVAAQD